MRGLEALQLGPVMVRRGYTASMTPDLSIDVFAFWDDEAGVWVARSEQVPGLVTEAETVEELSAELERLIPELLELNAPHRTGSPTTKSPTINLRAERTLHAH